MQHEGGLPGAVRPEQRHPFAARDGEVDAEQGLVPVGIGEREAGDLQGSGNSGHKIHPNRQTTRADDGSARAYDHSARDAVTSSMTGIEPE